ncbi:MAG: UDP-N-acetylglucosamine 1-carboxyvinyltransferase, partial [Firmicutes bacterium]|nr:UDP-N-acetylglucosamine 1-carboxyvinyltransferase [Bacillota bacterium]
VLAATILTGEETVIFDVPELADVEVMLGILRDLGVSARWEQGEGLTLVVRADNLRTFGVREDLSREMRSSIFLMGPLLSRLGRVRTSYPGGCAIGPRPIDIHLKGLRMLGAAIEERFGYIDARAERLRGADLHLDFPSVGATENLMMAAVLAEGMTVIRNAAKEPEIVDLQNFLNQMGARIKGAGTDVIRIDGVKKLRGAEHTLIPDRIEAGTFMAAGAITRGDVLLENVVPEHLEAVISKLKEAGVSISEEADGLRVRGTKRGRAVDLKTLPYPGFPTDLQPQMMAFLALAEGTSVMTELIFENRFKQAEELRRMGANIRTEGRTAVVKGVPALFGAMVQTPALREGASLVLAGLAAEGTTIVEGLEHIDRGYERLEGKLASLGGVIRREK